MARTERLRADAVTTAKPDGGPPHILLTPKARLPGSDGRGPHLRLLASPQMATLELKRIEVDRVRPPAVPIPGPNRSAALLGAALLVLSTYAIFAHGAIQPPAEPRIQVALAVLV